VDTTDAEWFLREWGFPIHIAAAEILHEFNDLDCHAKDTGSWLKFDVRQALMWGVPKQVPAFGRVIGEPLCPVACGNGCILLVAATGEAVWLQDEWLGYVRQASLAA